MFLAFSFSQNPLFDLTHQFITDTEMVMLKLVVEKEKNRVLFAESSKDLVDILFSFLTFPIGTIIRLTNKESNLGSMDKLYKSVEGLDIQYFHTKACKAMLLSPRSDSELKYCNLVLDLININDHMKYFACPSWTCATETNCALSLFENATCLCGQEVQELEHTSEGRRDRVAFVEGNCKFIITDDLHVSIMSAEARESILRRFNIIEGLSTEERFVHLGTREVLKLLKHSLVSKTPMTDVILEQGDILTSHMVKSEPLEYLKLQIYPTQTEEKRMDLKLIIKISSNTVLYAVANEDFLDLLFSFLAFPVGSVVKLLDGFSSIGSIDNLYKSVEDLCSRSPEKFAKCKDLLLHPMVAWHHGCENQILQIKEGDQRLEKYKIKLINPKYHDTVCKRGRGFIRKPMKFMVSDELYVLPYSPISSISFANKLGAQLNDLEERLVTVGEQQAMSILKESLTSKTALTNVFCQKSEGVHSCLERGNHRERRLKRPRLGPTVRDFDIYLSP